MARADSRPARPRNAPDRSPVSLRLESLQTPPTDPREHPLTT